MIRTFILPARMFIGGAGGAGWIISRRASKLDSKLMGVKGPTDKHMKNIILANKELNEWCGTSAINYYEGIEALGFLFKYPVPKLFELGLFGSLVFDKRFNRVIVISELGVKPKLEYIGEDKHPALALFWAIHEVITSP